MEHKKRYQAIGYIQESHRVIRPIKTNLGNNNRIVLKNHQSLNIWKQRSLGNNLV